MTCHVTTDVYQFHPATHGNFIVRMYHYITAQPWIGYIMITCFIHLTWVYLLLLAQLFQVGVARCSHVTPNYRCGLVYSHVINHVM